MIEIAGEIAKGANIAANRSLFREFDVLNSIDLFFLFLEMLHIHISTGSYKIIENNTSHIHLESIPLLPIDTIVYVLVPNQLEPTDNVWGTDIFSDDSDVLSAAIHYLGDIQLGDKDLVIKIIITDRLKYYTGSLRNGISSRGWGKHDGNSFRVLGYFHVIAGTAQVVGSMPKQDRYLIDFESLYNSKQAEKEKAAAENQNYTIAAAIQPQEAS